MTASACAASIGLSYHGASAPKSTVLEFRGSTAFSSLTFTPSQSAAIFTADGSGPLIKKDDLLRIR